MYRTICRAGIINKYTTWRRISHCIEQYVVLVLLIKLRLGIGSHNVENNMS